MCVYRGWLGYDWHNGIDSLLLEAWWWCPPAAAAATADTSLRTMTLMKGHVCSLELFLLQNFSDSCVRQLFWAANQWEHVFLCIKL